MNIPPPPPRARDEPSLLAQAAQQLLVAETLRRYEGRADLLLVGDSLTQNWQWDASWERVVAGRKVLNFGLGGDRTEHLLWRLEQGLADGLEVPRAAVLIGVNDLWRQPEPEAVVAGVEACVRRLRQALPEAELAVYGLFPLRGRARHLNALVSRVNRGLPPVARQAGAAFRDIGDRLLGPDGKVPALFMPDGCHLAEEAYALWTDDLLEWIRGPAA